MLFLKYLIIYILIFTAIFYISSKFSLTDNPNSRKLHKKKVFNTGGLILYFFLLTVIYLGEYNHNIELIISIGFFVALGGFVDDRIDLNPLSKISIILLPSIYLIFNGISINNLGNYEYIGILHLGKFELPFLILAIGLFVNSTNYIDGIDGLLLIFFISCMAYYIFIIDDPKIITLFGLILIPAIINLILNMLPNSSKLKFFTGDAGSLFIGFFICFLTIELYRTQNIHPTYLIWPLWYPVYDFLYVSIYRLSNNKSLLEPDKSHFHQFIFYKFNENRYKSILFFLGLNTTVIASGYFLSNQSKISSLGLFIIMFLVYFLIRKKLK